MLKRNESSNNGKYFHKNRVSTDGVSNMFSFNGGKSKRWNDIESTLKGNALPSLTPNNDMGSKSYS